MYSFSRSEQRYRSDAGSKVFPGIVMQGDTLSNVFNSVASALGDAKKRRDEEL